MDKIKEAFEKDYYGFNDKEEEIRMFNCFETGFKASNLLPTEKICPECKGEGFIRIGDNEEPDKTKCPNCKNGKIQIYYTPEEYKEITGEDYPDDALVWMKPYIAGLEFIFERYVHKKNVKGYITYIVQTAQPAPEADYER